MQLTHWKHWLRYMLRQWSTLWYLLQNTQALEPNLWRFKLSYFSGNDWYICFSSFPRPAQLWSTQTIRQPGSFSETSLLHDWFQSFSLKRQSSILTTDCASNCLANVRRKEHDVCCWSKTRAIPYCCSTIQRTCFNQRSWRVNVQYYQ